MPRALDSLKTRKKNLHKFLAAGTHLCNTSFDFQMEQYIYKQNKTKKKKQCHLHYTSEKNLQKLSLAACVFENPADISVTSSRNTGNWAVLKFVAVTGTTPIVRCLTPGIYSNQI